MFRSLIVGLLIASTTLARADDGAFLRAYGDKPSSRLLHEAQVAIDWQALARKHIRDVDVDHPSPAARAMLASRVNEVTASAELEFDAPLDPALSRASYVFISPQGVQPVSPITLRGTVSFGFDRRVITRTVFYGYVVAMAPTPAPGGFVHWSTGDATPSLIPDAVALLSDHGTTRTLRYRDKQGAASYELTSDDKRTKSKTIATAVGFRIAETRYVFIAWSADDACDEACCQNDFQIFRIGATLEPIAANTFDCDL